MFLRGINYDVGTPFRKDELSRPEFNEIEVKKEMQIIKNDLHCNAIRISGYDIQRLSKTAEFALEQGLRVWLSPACIDAATEQALNYLTDCAIAAEKLRSNYQDVVFVVGCEFPVFKRIYQRRHYLPEVGNDV